MQKHYPGPVFSQQIGIAALHERSAAQGKHQWPPRLGQDLAKHLGFELAKVFFSVTLEDVANLLAMPNFDLAVKIDKVPTCQQGKRPPHAALS